MTTSDNYEPLKEIGDGVTTEFSASWDMFAASFARVYLELISTGEQTLQTLGTDYTIEISASGFVVTFLTAPSDLYNVIVARAVPLEQNVSYRTSKGFQGEVLEITADKLVAMIQDVQDETDRSLKFPIASGTNGELPIPVDGRALIWSGVGGDIINGPTADEITNAQTSATAAAASAATATTAKDDAETARDEAEAFADSINPAQFVDLTSAQTLTNKTISASLNTLTGVSTPATLPTPNVLTNGGFDFWQRGTSFAITGSKQYLADRFYGLVTSAEHTVTRQACTFGVSQYCLRFQRDSGSSNTNFPTLAHSLESRDTIPLQGKTVTLQFRVNKGANYSGVSGEGVSIYYGTGTDENPVSGLTGETYLDGLAFDTDVTTVQSVTFTVPTNATQLFFNVNWYPTGTAGADDWLEFADFKLEVNSVASEYIAPNMQSELARCQRYFEKSFDIETAPSATLGAGTIGWMTPNRTDFVNFFFAAVLFKVSKRATPTVVAYGNATTGVAYDAGAGVDRAVNVGYAGTNGFFLTGTAVVISANTAMLYNYTVEAEI